MNYSAAFWVCRAHNGPDGTHKTFTHRCFFSQTRKPFLPHETKYSAALPTLVTSAGVSHSPPSLPAGRPPSRTGIGSRLMDGLQAPTGLERLQFYPPGYASPVGTLPFCADLPDNEVGLHFPPGALPCWVGRHWAGRNGPNVFRTLLVKCISSDEVPFVEEIVVT